MQQMMGSVMPWNTRAFILDDTLVP